MVLAHAQKIIADELYGRRTECGDLIHNIFGNIVSLGDASVIPGDLVEHELLTVPTGASEERDWCAHATKQANLGVNTTPSKSGADKSVWQWNKLLTTEEGIGSEAGAVRFFNVLGLAAYIIAVRRGLKCVTGDDSKPSRSPKRRFTRLPYEEEISMGYKHEKQDCRPDFIVLPMDCYTTDTSKDACGGLKHDNPALIIKTIHSLAQTTLNRTTDNEIDILTEWWDTQLSLAAINKRRYCWSQVDVTGVAKLSKLGAAMNEELVCMHAHRLSQSWRVPTIGLSTSSDKVVIFRADPNGVEECVIPYSISRGVIEMVRLSLGIALASDEELGCHPWMELAQTIADGDDSTPDQRIVQYITIPGHSMPPGPLVHNPPPFDSPPARYFVHELLEDRGSLVGRCPRLFVVSREVQPSSSSSTGSRFQGPYVLKVYYADIESACVKGRIMETIKEKKVDKVLLPNR
jgi:hypothetical protein